MDSTYCSNTIVSSVYNGCYFHADIEVCVCFQFNLPVVNHKMESEFFQYLTEDGSEPAAVLSEDMSNTSNADHEWVSMPEVCRKDLLHLYVNELGELTNRKECLGETQFGTYVVGNSLETESGQEQCKKEGEDEECTYLELKTVPVEAYSQVLCGGADGFSYVKTGQNCMESYRDEFGFYISSLPDLCRDTEIRLPEETASLSHSEQSSNVESDYHSELQARHIDSGNPLGEQHETIDSKVDSVSLMKLRLHRIISNSEKSIRQSTSNSEERLSDCKVAASRPVNVRVDVPVRKMSCPMVSQIAATILDRWKSMRPLGVTGLDDLPKCTASNMKTKLISRSGPTSSGQHGAVREGPGRKVVREKQGAVVDKDQAKGSRASRALDRRRESQLALEQLQQMSRPVFKRRGRPDAPQRTST